jgi:hypothetical protein
MPQFVKIMKKAIPHKKEDESTIIAKLCHLFAEIDVDNDKCVSFLPQIFLTCRDREMTWEEFTSFIIKSGVEPYDPINSMKSYQEIIPAVDTYFQSLSKLKYFPQLDRVVCCENNSNKTVKLFRQFIAFYCEFLQS